MAYRYSAWDGTQTVEVLAPEEMLSALADDLLAGKIDQALDRALNRGVTSPDGDTLDGLDQVRDRLRAERRAVEDALAHDETLQRLAEQLQAGAAGGTEGLDQETRRLLEALAAHPNDAARILGGADASVRELIEAAIEEIRQGRGGAGGEFNLSSPGAFSGAIGDLLNRLDALDELQQDIRGVRHVSDVDDIDPERIRDLLGSDAAFRFVRLSASLREFAESGYVRGSAGKRELSARALQHIGDELLNATLSRLASHQPGDRPRSDRAGAHEPTGATREYRFGDPLALDLSRTMLQAVRREPGVPLRIHPSDFAIIEREETARAVTVLAIDLSRSMGERGYLSAAKKLALQMSTLVRLRFPRDRLLLAGFSEAARTIEPGELPRLTWDRFSYGTNIQEALRLGRNLLAAHRGVQRNIILLTDGEPTAHRDAEGKIHFGHPPYPETLTATYAEAAWLRRDDIALYVCVLSSQFQVVRFARQLADRAGGDLIVTSPDDLDAAIILRYGQRRAR